MKRRKRAGALVALAVLGSLFVPGTARAAETFEIQVYQGFFEQGIPGFSARIYPGSITVHKGDTIHFSESLLLLPEGVYPQDFVPEAVLRTSGQLSFLHADPDDGENAIKINEVNPYEQDCGTQANPCAWGSNTDPVISPFPAEDDPNPDFSQWVTIDANPGTVLWGNSFASSSVNTNIEVRVVAPNEPASTQAELDARAAQLLEKDYEDAAALHNKMGAKRTSHTNSQGQKVYDIWVGATGGPIELLASYPRKIRVPRGARVMYHFQGELEPHTATFGGAKARNLFQNGFMPVCDPDGDAGTAPDTAPDFSNPDAPCAPPAELEVDIDDRILYETGDGRVTGPNDLENSGLKLPVFPEETYFDSNPWTVRMTKTTDAKGYKYICLVHGGFMGGRVVVK